MGEQNLTEAQPFAFRAEVGAHSSVVGTSVHLLADTGKMVGQIAFLCHDDTLRERSVQERLARAIAEAVNTHPHDLESLRVKLERLQADMQAHGVKLQEQNQKLEEQARKDRRLADAASDDALLWQFSIYDGQHDGQPLLVRVWYQRREATARAKKAETELAGCKIALEQAWASIRERDAQIAALTPQSDAGLEAAIREAIDLLAERTQGSPARSASHNARLVLEAALRSRSVGEVAVKPLVWEVTGWQSGDGIKGENDDTWSAPALGFRCSTYDIDWFGASIFRLTDPDDNRTPHPTLDAAKAAAQADYAARIRAALEGGEG